MKRLLILSLMFALGSTMTVSSSFAQESGSRPANPGDDPNEAMKTSATEAEVAATGTCDQCLAHLKHTRLGDPTAFRPGGSQSETPSGSSSSKGGTR